MTAGETNNSNSDGRSDSDGRSNSAGRSNGAGNDSSGWLAFGGRGCGWTTVTGCVAGADAEEDVVLGDGEGGGE